jgi:hypothetical protein
MDDINGKKSACWKKTRTLEPSFREVLVKIEEVRAALEAEKRSLLAIQEVPPLQDGGVEVHDLDVGTGSDG